MKTTTNTETTTAAELLADLDRLLVLRGEAMMMTIGRPQHHPETVAAYEALDVARKAFEAKMSKAVR